MADHSLRQHSGPPVKPYPQSTSTRHVRFKQTSWDALQHHADHTQPSNHCEKASVGAAVAFRTPEAGLLFQLNTACTALATMYVYCVHANTHTSPGVLSAVQPV
jgi:hypothetical protein